MNNIQAVLIQQLTGAWRYRWVAAAFSWLFCLAGWVFVYNIPNTYEASTRIYVDADAVLTPLLRGIAVDSPTSSQVDVLQRTLLSRPNLEKLISKTGLELQIAAPGDRDRLVQQLAQDIRIQLQTNSLFTITYRNSSAKLSYDVVQSMLNTFIESKTGNNRAEMMNAQLFLQQQINQYETQLRDAEKKRAEFRTQYIDILPAVDGGVSKFEASQQNVRQLEGQLKDALARRDTLNKELASTPAQIVTETDPGGAGGGGGNGRLRDAERQLALLRATLTDQHPDVVALKNQIAVLRANPGGSSDAPAAPRTAARNHTASNPVYEQLKTRMVDNDSAIASLQRQLDDETKERERLLAIARSAPSVQADFGALNRDYDVVRENYDKLLARRESMKIASAADTDADKIKIQVIDPPKVPVTPVAPKRTLLMSGVLLAGLAGGLGLAVMLVQLDGSFHSTDDLRSLGLPVMGGISLLAMATSFRTRLVGALTFASVVLLLCAVFGGLVIGLKMPGGLA